MSLVTAGLIRVERGGTRPQYSILHAHQQGKPSPLTSEEQRIYDIIRTGQNAVPKIGRHDTVWQSGRPYEMAMALVQKGYLKDHGGHRFTIVDLKEQKHEEPDLIWLPCSLVEAPKEDGPLTPIEQIRQSNKICALRLFIDLYHAHDLINGPGINWRHLTVCGSSMSACYLGSVVNITFGALSLSTTKSIQRRHFVSRTSIVPRRSLQRSSLQL